MEVCGWSNRRQKPPEAATRFAKGVQPGRAIEPEREAEVKSRTFLGGDLRPSVLFSSAQNSSNLQGGFHPAWDFRVTTDRTASTYSPGCVAEIQPGLPTFARGRLRRPVGLP